MEGEPKCWLATVRFQSRGLWYEYVAALSWAAKAFGGEADAITFGEHMLGAAIMLCGMVMTALLIGEIANVLTNFDPGLKRLPDVHGQPEPVYHRAEHYDFPEKAPEGVLHQ